MQVQSSGSNHDLKTEEGGHGCLKVLDVPNQVISLLSVDSQSSTVPSPILWLKLPLRCIKHHRFAKHGTSPGA